MNAHAWNWAGGSNDDAGVSTLTRDKGIPGTGDSRRPDAPWVRPDPVLYDEDEDEEDEDEVFGDDEEFADDEEFDEEDDDFLEDEEEELDDEGEEDEEDDDEF